MKELHGTVENEQAKSKAIIEEKIKSLQNGNAFCHNTRI